MTTLDNLGSPHQIDFAAPCRSKISVEDSISFRRKPLAGEPLSGLPHPCVPLSLLATDDLGKDDGATKFAVDPPEPYSPRDRRRYAKGLSSKRFR